MHYIAWSVLCILLKTVSIGVLLYWLLWWIEYVMAIFRLPLMILVRRLQLMPSSFISAFCIQKICQILRADIRFGCFDRNNGLIFAKRLLTPARNKVNTGSRDEQETGTHGSGYGQPPAYTLCRTLPLLHDSKVELISPIPNHHSYSQGNVLPWILNPTD